MNAIIKLSLRNIAQKKIKFFILFLTFMLSTLTLITTVCLKDSAIESREQQLRNNTLNSQIVIRTKSDKDIYFNPDYILSKLQNIKDIKYAVERCGGIAINKSLKNELINVIGVNFDKQSKVYSFNLVKQSRLTDIQNPIIISESYSAKNNLKVGDTVVLAYKDKELNFKVAGIAENKGIFENSNIVVLKIEDAQELFSKKGLVYTIGITLDKLDNISNVVNQLKKIIDEKYEVEQRYDIESYRAYVGTIDIALRIFSSFAIFITLFLTYSTFKTLLYERISQIGTLRSVGATKLQIFLSVYLENFIIVLFSSFIGTILSYPFISFVLKLIAGDDIKINISFIKILIVFMVMVFVGLFSVILSILDMMNFSIVDIIKGNITKPRTEKFNTKFLIGFIMLLVSIVLYVVSIYYLINVYVLILGIVFFSLSFILLIEFLHNIINNTLFNLINLFGTKGRLLYKEFKRDFIKTAESITLISIVVGIAYLSFTISYLIRNSVNNVYNGISFVITTDNSIQMLENKLSSIEGIEEVISQYRINKNIKDMEVEISGIDADEYERISFETFKIGSKYDTFRQLTQGRNIIITTTFAQNTNTKVGDFIKIKTDEKDVDYKVIGVVSSFENMGKVLFVSKNYFIKDFNHPNYSLFLVKTKPDYNIADVEVRINKLLEGNNGFYNVSSLKKMQEENSKDNNKLFFIVNILFFITILISIISLNNNFIINILTQIRVFAVKRTIGMSLKQLIFNIFGKGMLIGLEGGVFGILFGFSLNLYMIRILSYYIGELSFGYKFSIFLMLLLVSTSIGFLGSIYPSCKIRKTDLIQAIKSIE
ncbi:FtsX-like permease family protein [Caloramator sp. ALD01]|uniref:ABC transporter permease n=1 Tax=Caloramator sp. ALD01 TaxID=1031288 RepID=UPI000409A9D5|nr:FtsX-like permease family protein [Caloramator sp. ALD01]